MVRQNTFRRLTKSFTQLQLDQIQETVKVLFSYYTINTSKEPDKVFQLIHSTEKIGINFAFFPCSCLWENSSHSWLPVRDVTRACKFILYNCFGI